MSCTSHLPLVPQSAAGASRACRVVIASVFAAACPAAWGCDDAHLIFPFYSGPTNRYITSGNLVLNTDALGCNTDVLVIESGGQLQNAIGAAITNEADGRLYNIGTFANTGVLVNLGQLVNVKDVGNFGVRGGILSNSGSFINQATFINQYTLQNTGSLDNRSMFVAEGGGQFYNEWMFTNSGVVVFNDAGLASRAGAIINNSGSFLVSAGGNFSNQGSFNNLLGGTLQLDNVFSFNFTGGTLNNNGILIANFGLDFGAERFGAINLLAPGEVFSASTSVRQDVSQQSDGIFHSAGLFSNGGTFRNTGSFDLVGTYQNAFANGFATTINDGSFVIQSTGTVANNGWFFNTNQLTVKAGGIFQNGTLDPNSGQPTPALLVNQAAMTIEAGSRLINKATVQNFGSLLNEGAVESSGAFYNDGTLDNGTQFNNTGAFDSSGTLLNRGDFFSSGTVNASGSIDNFGTFGNAGNMFSSGSFSNRGTFNNSNYFQNLGAFVNTGTIDNTGGIDNDGSFRHESGVITNAGDIVNRGSFVVLPGAKLVSPGLITNDGSSAALTVDSGSINFAGGTLSSSGRLFVSGSLDFGAPRWGTIRLLPGGQVQLPLGGSVAANYSQANQGSIVNGAGFVIQGSFSNGGTFENYGDLLISSGANFIGHLEVAAGGWVWNRGTLYNHGSVLINAGGLLENGYRFGGPGLFATLQNDGLLTVEGTLINVAVIQNSGTLITAGTFRNQGIFTNTGSLVSSGPFENTDRFTTFNRFILDGQFTNSGVLQFAAGSTTTGFGTLMQTSGRTTVDGILNIRSVEIFGGELCGTGSLGRTLVLIDGGHICPGHSPGTLTLEGDLDFLSGFLDLEIAGAAAGQYDVLVVGGRASFSAGTLKLAFLDGYLPQLGDHWALLALRGGTSGFTNLNTEIDGLPAGYQFALTLDNDGVAVLTVTEVGAVPEAPDWALLAAGLLLLRGMPRCRTRCARDGRHAADAAAAEAER